MLFKVFLVAFMAVGVLGEFKLNDDARQKIKDTIKNTCTENGAADKIDQVEESIKNFVDCFKGLFNFETLKNEIEAAKPNGALDEVFKKYCAKSPQLKTCIHTLTEGVTPCLPANIRDNLGAGKNVSDQLIDFVCYKDGDRIALFIAEGGPECFQEKSGSLRECATKAREGITGVESVKALSVDEQCAKFDALSSCIVKALEECSTPTPGNMAESLLRYIRKGTPCKSN
ncbi:27 kDa hemolymph protein-like [Zerene cesonia]|uniref:27 kDa hemolymph protein-like n=1 Tax=Zerene cesonia TaxID=33412 RepID=UPI0018E4DC06|nr:27 kDa hemolymph protein-like [Zerene cesonia]